MLNQVLYTEVYVGPDGVVRVGYTEGFAWLLGEEGADGPEVVVGTAEAVLDFDDSGKDGDGIEENGSGDAGLGQVLVLRPGRDANRPGRGAGGVSPGFF
ncbi:MAG: hypothetical protein ACT4PX_09765 [Actinomycetota bacterium]